MPYHNLDEEITEKSKADVFNCIGQIESSLPFLINLTNEERRTLPTMGDATQSFVAKALEIATNNPQFIPPYADIAAMKKDFDLATTLQAMEIQFASLYEKISDTRLAAGSEAYVIGLTVYKSLKAAAKLNLPGAKSLVSELGTHFEGITGRPPGKTVKPE